MVYFPFSCLIGPWSDADHIWKKIEFQEIARFLEFQEKPDGEFFMEFSHFISIFRGVTICTTEPQFTINGKVVNGFEMSIKVIKIKVKKFTSNCCALDD